MSPFTERTPTVPGREAGVFSADVDTRAAFIVKTYTHLFGAMILFILVECFMFVSGLAEPIASVAMRVNWIIPLAAFGIVSWFASRTAASARSLGAQYVALVVYVVAEAIIFVPLLYIAVEVLEDRNILGQAMIVTLLGFGALTAIVFVTRKDFSFLKGALIWGSICAFALIAVSLLAGFSLGPIFSVAMIAIAGGAILYDTSNVLHHYPEDRYVSASLQLFASIALLFWYVLRLFMSRN